jgi:phosphonate transport system permease protein
VSLTAAAALERAWRARGRRRRRDAILGALLFIAALAGSLVVSEVSPRHLAEGVPGMLRYIAGTLPVLRPGSLVTDVAEWYWGLGQWLVLLGDTLLMAFMGTVLGALAAAVLSFPASRTLVRSRAVYFVARRGLEIARTVPELVYALIFVYAFGLGPLPGVMAIAIHSAGALGKLFAEANENAELGPLEGVQAAGGTWAIGMRYAIVPQVLPAFLSYALLRFEINVRSSAVLGFVGAGGIGQELYTVIRQFIYVDISAIVLLLIATVVVIDLACERLRHRVIGTPA